MLQNATSLGKSVPRPPNISDEHVSCTARATRNASFQILFKCPTPVIVFGHATKALAFCSLFDNVHNPLHLPHQTTSERPKAVRDRQFLTLLTSKRASRRNGVHFFDISTSKSASELLCFVHFDFDMCIAPQRRALFRHLNCAPTLVRLAHFDFQMCFVPQRCALFRHLNFQKCFGASVLCTF